jgi:hypothetical protein
MEVVEFAAEVEFALGCRDELGIHDFRVELAAGYRVRKDVARACTATVENGASLA